MIEKKVAARYADSSPARTTEDEEPSNTEQTPLIPKATSTPKRYRLSKPTNRFTRSLPILLIFRDPGLLTAIWIAFMQALIFGAFDATIPLVASEQFGFNSLKAGLLFLPLGGADFLFGPVFGWCVDRYGTRPLSIIGFAALVPALVLLRLPTDASLAGKMDNPRHVALYAALLAANGIGLAAVSSLSIVEAGNIVEKYWQANKELFEQAPYAQLYGINSMVFSGGLTLGPLIAGYLREMIGYGNMNAVLAGICGVTAIVGGVFMGREEQDLREREEDGE
jgi:MFS family permease